MHTPFRAILSSLDVFFTLEVVAGPKCKIGLAYSLVIHRSYDDMMSVTWIM